MVLHLWLTGMLIIHLNDPLYAQYDCETAKQYVQADLQNRVNREGGLLTIAGTRHPIHHITLTCEPIALPLGTVRQ